MTCRNSEGRAREPTAGPIHPNTGVDLEFCVFLHFVSVIKAGRIEKEQGRNRLSKDSRRCIVLGIVHVPK